MSKMLATILVQCYFEYDISLWDWGLLSLKQKLQAAQNT